MKRSLKQTKYRLGIAALMNSLYICFAIAQSNTPNVLVIYYDDMGYSDMGAYDTNQSSLTPNLDSLAADGMLFTAGHSADAVCTPSRYALMTGRYCWRSSRKSGVTGAYSPPLIEEDRFTFAKMFQSLGYETAMVGKWHVGMQFYDASGAPTGSSKNVDFSQNLTSTPYHIGFDYFFGTSASLDLEPYAWIENDTVLFKGGMVVNGSVDFSQATQASNSDFLNGNPVGASTRDGYYDPNFDLRDYLQVQAAKTAEIIEARAQDGLPFFIYVAMPSPHTPWAVQSQFAGISSYTYGDYLYQTDYYTGVILDALADPDGDPNTDDSLVDTTVVFISSDNGPEKVAQSQSLAQGRDSNGPFRGVKRDNWEGGTRVPFVIRWPGMIPAGSRTDHACWQGDFFATIAAYLGYDFTGDEAPDVESFLPILSGNSMQAQRREGFIQHSVSGQMAIVDKTGQWKLLDGTGGDGYDDTYDENDNVVTGAKGTRYGTPRQLFDLLADPGESNNLLLAPTAEHTAKETELYSLLNEIRGNTTTGTDGNSNVPLPDNDKDGMPNAFENQHPRLNRDDPSDAETDLEPDGLTNLEESQNGCDPTRADTDGDRLPDGDEVNIYATQPDSAHSDNDSLEDGDEILVWNTNPLIADSDNDGVNDDIELSNFHNPRNTSSTPTLGAMIQTELSPLIIQLAGFDGTVNDPAIEGGASSGWSEAGAVFVRSRLSGNEQLKTRAFIKFDLNGLSGNLVSAKLRVHQTHKLNGTYTADLQLARATDDWGNTAGNYPLYEGTGIADTVLFGNTGDFGSSSSSSGFFSGTPGSAGDDNGFDITDIVEGWINGSYPNYGIRISINDLSFTGSALSEFDDLSTSNSDEALELIVRTQSYISQDSDQDGLLDTYENSKYGDLSISGADDPDQNGIPEILELAFGGTGSATNSAGFIRVDTGSNMGISIRFDQHTQLGFGYELLLSENLTNWEPFNTLYEYRSSSPSTLGADYEAVIYEPIAALPENLFYKLNVQTIYSF